MNISEVRKRYLDFFEKRGHKIVPSASLVPENDPTTLFTGSGMQPMVPYLMGEKHPLGDRIVNSQKCFRAEDIEEVGDNRHTTFFEMLGNWSLGDYFKKEQLRWFFEFLTDKEEGLGLSPERFFVTVFSGDEDNDLPRDNESVEIWEKIFAEKGVLAKVVDLGTEERGGELGMQGGRIFAYGSKKNWWSRAGIPSNMPIGEIGGPDSEVFYDFETEHDRSYGEHCHPNCDCGRFVEIGNSVFMQYIKTAEGTFEKLPKENVDFGGGLERIAAMTLRSDDVFLSDAFTGVIDKLESFSGKSYHDTEYTKSFRVVADHMRGAVFMVGDGVLPSNSERGYFVRRLLRRSIRHMDLLGASAHSISEIVTPLVNIYGDVYPELNDKAEEISSVFADEEVKFRRTLERGMREFEKIVQKNKEISGKDAFVLFSSYGFPVELTKELADERGVSVDIKGFKEEFAEHQEKSRLGAEKKFKGGLGDTSEMSVKYHTATHLLNAALREVLGEFVEQRGSNITPERLRFDFSHHSKMTDDEKSRVEYIVNQAIDDELPVTFEEIPLEEARAMGAVGVFTDKYDEIVKVYIIGDRDNPFSVEICGGPHVENTAELGRFKIKKEEASSAGVRRIKAVLE